MLEEVVTICNSLGLHLRAAGMFAQVANRYVSGIYVKKGSMKVNAKSTIGVMMLAAGKGTQLTLIADGADEAEAIEALITLVESGFNEV